MKTKKTISIICVIMSVMLAFCGLSGCTPQEKPENKDPREEYITKLEQYVPGMSDNCYYKQNPESDKFINEYFSDEQSSVYLERIDIIRNAGIEEIKTAKDETEWKNIVYETTKKMYLAANEAVLYEAGLLLFVNTSEKPYTVPEKWKAQAAEDKIKVLEKRSHDKEVNAALLNWLNDRLYYYSCSEYKTRFVPGLVTPQEFERSYSSLATGGYRIAFSDEYKNFTYDLYYTHIAVLPSSAWLKCVPGDSVRWSAYSSEYISRITHFMAIVYDEGQIAGYVLFKYTSLPDVNMLCETSSITVDASVLFEKDEEGNYPKIESNFFDGLLSVYMDSESFVNAQIIYKAEDDGKYTPIQQLHFPLYEGNDAYEYEISVVNGTIFEMSDFEITAKKAYKWKAGNSSKTLTVKPGARIGLSEMGENELTVTVKEKTTGKAIKKAQVIIKKNKGTYDYTYYVNEVE